MTRNRRAQCVSTPPLGRAIKAKLSGAINGGPPQNFDRSEFVPQGELHHTRVGQEALEVTERGAGVNSGD